MKTIKTEMNNSDHPWDTEERNTRVSRGFPVIFTLLFSFIIISSVSAQGPIPPPAPIDPEYEELKQLTRNQKQVAEDYHEILDRLESLLDDYIKYFSRFDQLQGKKSQNKLTKVLINLEKGKYYDDVEYLSDDLTSLIDFLREEEKLLKKQSNSSKLYKNMRTLRREIELLEDIVDEEIAGNLDREEKHLEHIKFYILEKSQAEKAKKEYYVKMLELASKLKQEAVAIQLQEDSIKFILGEEYLKELKETVLLQDELLEAIELAVESEVIDKIANIKIPDVKVVPVPPRNVPDIPDIPDVPETSLTYIYQLGKTTNTKSIHDSAYVSSAQKPIYINNHTGELIVNGWNKDKVIVSYKVEVSADSKNKTIDLIDEIDLKLINSKDGIYVSTSFPHLKDASSQVINSKMIVNLPRKNPVICENSFGYTKIDNLANNLSISTKMSDTYIQNVKGEVEAVSSLGSNTFYNISGKLNLRGKKGKVVLEDCNATIDIVNSFAAVILSGCTGPTTIHNSGNITIEEHTGDIEVQNKNGLVKVGKIKGNLNLANSYQPLFVRSVNGSVTIENRNAKIDVSDISGLTTAVNNRGMIAAKELNGPINFTINSGEIMVDFDGTLNDNSFINADYSVVYLYLSEDANIQVDASTDGGTISSSFQTEIKKDDLFVSRTQLALGNPSHTLLVNGTNTSIIISNER